MKYLIDPERLRDALIREGGEHIGRRMTARGDYITMAVAAMIAGKNIPEWAEEAPQKPARATKAAKPTQEYTPEFEAFWAAYPSRGGVKSGKAPAFKVWLKTAKTFEGEKPLRYLCLMALEWQKQTEQWQEASGKYIPMATTYLNQRRFEDERPASEDPAPKTAGPMNWEEFE